MEGKGTSNTCVKIGGYCLLGVLTRGVPRGGGCQPPWISEIFGFQGLFGPSGTEPPPPWTDSCVRPTIEFFSGNYCYQLQNNSNICNFGSFSLIIIDYNQKRLNARHGIVWVSNWGMINCENNLLSLIWYKIIRNENVLDCFSGQLEFSNSEPCTFRTIASFSHGKVKWNF